MIWDVSIGNFDFLSIRKGVFVFDSNSGNVDRMFFTNSLKKFTLNFVGLVVTLSYLECPFPFISVYVLLYCDITTTG